MTIAQKIFLVSFILITVVSLYLASGMDHGMSRHHRGMFGIPEQYKNKSNPLNSSTAVINRGAKIYQVNCFSCHGSKGYGDGPASANLLPRPANLSYLISNMFMAKDNYLFWTISEGGKAFDTAMPVFKNQLTEEERWSVIRFLRTL